MAEEPARQRAPMMGWGVTRDTGINKGAQVQGEQGQRRTEKLQEESKRVQEEADRKQAEGQAPEAFIAGDSKSQQK